MGKLSGNRTRHFQLIFLLTLSSAVLGYLLTNTQPFRTLELKWIDLMFEMRGPLPDVESPIVLVAISEQSDFELPEKFPWPTSYYARLIDNLNEAGAAVIGIDVIFDKADIYDPRNDTLFAEAMKRHGNVILAGNIMREIQRATHAEIRGAVVGQQLVQPYRLLDEANPNRWGFVFVNRDLDGYLRRYPLEFRHIDETYHSFGLEVIKLYKGITDDQTGFTERGYRLGDIEIPRWDSSNMYINYIGYPGTFPEYNFSDVIDTEDFFTLSEDEFFQINAFDDPEFGLLHQDIFRDKIVLVGATMPELHDFYPTPFAPHGTMPGYESHASAIQTIVSGQFITRPSHLVTILLIVLFAAFVTIATAVFSVRTGVLFIVLIIAGYYFTLFTLFTEKRLIVEMVGPAATMLIAYLSTVVYGFLNEQKEKKRIQSIFGSYVAPELVERMVASGEEPRLGGERTHITAFFTDIAGFSTFSEKLPPEGLVELMNEYLSAMTDILIDEGGTLDKYIGDAIVAFFGAPVPLPDHAYRSCITAHKMQQKQAELRRKWLSEGDRWPDIVAKMQTRIGINTGEVITGNMGSEKRFNYTMMGDDVNLAARCESGAKSYGVYTMVTDQTRRESEASGDRCVFRRLDRIVVKGRTQPVDIYELAGFREELSEADFDCIRIFENGLQHYFKQLWAEAESMFRESARLERHQPANMPEALKDMEPTKSDGLPVETNPSLVMLERISSLRANPPGPGWDGVYVMKTK